MMYLELFMVFFILCVSSFVLFYLVYKQNDPEVTDMVSKRVGHDKATKKQKAKTMKKNFSATSILASKWVEFGGGFYGLVAVLTYILLEINEIIELFSSKLGIMAAIYELGFGSIIDFFIESLMNFIVAITWPVYWMGEGSAPFWQWFLAAYAGYFVGQFIAKAKFESTAAK
ncbi:hypothetical protein [Marinicella rhabdoformis]|uniref:hypothetical protein n=1 Tax=Marinicella rhabdoformis TaxID=2580566 RepID=UPI0012AED69D|nr:hypothetical protein [Marinicella rhabdoformis]